MANERKRWSRMRGGERGGNDEVSDETAARAGRYFARNVAK